MGIEVAALAIAAVATAGKMAAEASAASAKEQSLDLQLKQSQVQYSQKQLSNLDTMEKVLDAQAAELTTRGVSFGSPSFNAIQRNTLNISAKKSANTKTEQSFMESSIDIEKENTMNSLWAQMFGDVASFAGSAASVAAKTPTKAPEKLPQIGD